MQNNWQDALHTKNHSIYSQSHSAPTTLTPQGYFNRAYFVLDRTGKRLNERSCPACHLLRRGACSAYSLHPACTLLCLFLAQAWRTQATSQHSLLSTIYTCWEPWTLIYLTAVTFQSCHNVVSVASHILMGMGNCKETTHTSIYHNSFSLAQLLRAFWTQRNGY